MAIIALISWETGRCYVKACLNLNFLTMQNMYLTTIFLQSKVHAVLLSLNMSIVRHLCASTMTLNADSLKMRLIRLALSAGKSTPASMLPQPKVIRLVHILSWPERVFSDFLDWKVG